MRKILSSIMFVAVAAMASVSCQKEEKAPVNETKSATLTLQATVADTKTYIEDNAVLWGTNEYVQLYFNDGVNAQFKKSNDTYANEWNESDQAMFAFDIEYTQANSYVLGGIYPASATDGISNTNAASFKLALPSVQNATVSSYDPAAFIMIMRPETVTDADFDKSGHIAYFRRAVALNKLTLKGVKETINSVSITVEGKDLAGRRYFDLTTGEGGDVYYGQTSTITVYGAYASGDIDVWFTSWGAEITEGETLKVVLKSDTKTYTKTINARAEGIKFVEGDLNKLAIDMSSVTGVISAQSLPFEKDFSDKTGTDGLTELEGFTVSGSVYDASGAIRLAKSTGPGTVTTESLDLSDEFHVIVDATGWDPDEVVMTVSAGEQTNELTLSTYGENSQPGVFVSYVINFEPVGENATVSFTAASGKRVYIQKIQVLEGHAELPSILTVTAPEQMSAEGGNGSFSYTLTNPKDGLELTVSEDADWITDVEAAKGTVTYTVGANITEDPREAVITLTYGDLTETVTVSQKGQAAVGVAYYEKVTSAPADWSGTYLMVCDSKNMVLSGISTTSTKYGIGTDVSIEDSKIKATEELASYQVVLSSGTTSGSYLMKFNNSYLYWSSGNSLATNTSDNANTNWILSVSDGNVTIKNCKDNTRIIGWNASSPRFACYTSSQTAIQLYKLEDGNAGGETPVEKTLESIAVSGAKTEYTVGDEFVEPTVTATYSDGSTEDVTASAEFTGYNMLAADTYTVTVSYSGKTTTYSITVSAAQGGGEDGGETTGGYTLVTSLSDITTGQYVIAAKVDGTYYAMSNTFASKINGTSVTVTDNAISESDAQSYVVSITKDGANYYISSGTNYLKYKSSTDLGTQSDQYSWTIEAGTNGTFRINATTGTNRAIMYQISGARFGGYATTNASGYADIELFKKN